MGQVDPFATAQFSACPACAVAPLAVMQARNGVKPMAGHHCEKIILSVPTAHCAACMRSIETALSARADVVQARVNLSLKRVLIDLAFPVDPKNLIQTLAELGYQAQVLDQGLLSSKQSDKAGDDLLMCLAVAGFSAMNVMLFSVAVWSGADAATRDMLHWISAAIALPTVAFSGLPFFKSAASVLRHGHINMDVPISLALILASALSLFETLQGGVHAYFDAAVMLAFFLLAGRYLDHRTRALARSAALELAALEVADAHLITNGTETLAHILTLNPGDHIRIYPGERLPADGVILDGQAQIDRALLTGESLPVFASQGDPVAAGEVNLSGHLTVQVTAAAEDSSLYKMADMVMAAEMSKGRYASLADRAAQIYAPMVHILAALAFAYWLWVLGDLYRAVTIAIAVLIITCPCALGLAVPSVVVRASGRLFKRGVLLKHQTALERLAQIDTVVFDKTGTLTYGQLQIAADIDPKLLHMAQSLARHSTHPLSKALATTATVDPLPITDLQEEWGMGISGTYQGQPLRLGRAMWCDMVEAPQTATYFSYGKDKLLIPFQDCLRSGALDAINALRAQGLKIILLSGDTPLAVADMARRLGIETFHAHQRPEEKLNFMNNLAATGGRALMVGDGLNDTAALVAAHASIAPASGLDAARVAADMVLLNDDLLSIPQAFAIAKTARRRILENFGLSLSYNLVAVPFAFLGLATPLMAALAMSLSSITVSLNALRVK